MWWPAQGHDGRDSQPFSYRTTRFNSYTTKHEVKMRNNWWLYLLVQLRAAPINDLDEGVFKRRLCLTWLRLQQSMNRKRKNVGHLISLQSTRHIPIAAEVEQPEPRSEGHAESFSRFHQVLHHLYFFCQRLLFHAWSWWAPSWLLCKNTANVKYEIFLLGD